MAASFVINDGEDCHYLGQPTHIGSIRGCDVGGAYVRGFQYVSRANDYDTHAS